MTSGFGRNTCTIYYPFTSVCTYNFVNFAKLAEVPDKSPVSYHLLNTRKRFWRVYNVCLETFVTTESSKTDVYASSNKSYVRFIGIKLLATYTSATDVYEP